MSIIALIGCLLASSAQSDEPKTVTLTSHGLTVGEILEKVRKDTGLEVYAGNVSTNRIVAVVPTLPAKEFLEKLAWTLNAEWQPYEKGVKLERTPSQFAENKSQAYGNRLEGIRKGLLEAARNLANNNRFADKDLDAKLDQAAAQFRKQYENFRGQEEEKYFNLGSVGNPANLVLEEVLRKMPPKVLAGLDPKQRAVFALTPTRFQRPMPMALTSVAQFAQARRAIQQLAKKARGNTTARVYTGLSRDDRNFDEVGEVLARFTSNGSRDYISADVLIANPAGEVVGTASVSVRTRAGGDAPVTIPQLTIPFRPESQKLARALTNGNRGGGIMEFDVAYPSSPWNLDATAASVEQILLDPVGHEPLQYGASEMVDTIAEKLNKPVIAYVSDAMASRMMSYASQKQANLTQMLSTDTQIQNTNCFLLRPLNLSEAVDSEFSRVELKKLIGKIKDVGYLRLAEVMEYRHMGSGNPNYGSLDMRWVGACSLQIMNQIISSNDRALDIMRAFGWTSERMAQGSQRISFASWPQSIKDKVQELMASGNFRFYSGNPTELEQHEPTEMRDDQIDRAITLRVDCSVNKIVYAVAKGESTGRFLYGYQLGSRRNPLNAAINPGMAQFPTQFASYRAATLKSINFSFSFAAQDPTAARVPNQANLTRMVSYDAGFGGLSDVLSISPDTLTEDQLPEDVRRDITNGMKARGPMYNPGDRGYRPPIPPR